MRNGFATIGGPGRNVISGNGVGVFVDFQATSVDIARNDVGTDINIKNPIGNGTGIESHAGLRTSISSNVIAGNGIGISTDGAVISSNFVGLSSDLVTRIPNGTGIAGSGVISNNVISGNDYGITASGNVNHNWIGTDPAGNPFGNLHDGVKGAGGTYTNNVIAYNGGAGVLRPRLALGLAIRHNSIYANAGLGIDRTSTDTGDGENPNDSDNFIQHPNLGSAVTDGNSTIVEGELNQGPPGTLEFFSNATPDPSGWGEGETFIGSLDLTATAPSFRATLPAVPAGRYITATFTKNAPNETSEFSNAVPVVTTATDLRVGIDPPVVPPGPDVTFTINVGNDGPQSATSTVLTVSSPSPFVSFTQTSGPVFNCTTPTVGNPPAIQCTISTFDVANTATFALTVSGSSGEVRAHAAVSSTSNDVNPSNNVADASTIVAHPDVAITKSAALTAAPGSLLRYTIDVMNRGTANGENVVFKDTLPEGTTFVRLTNTGGVAFVCVAETNVTCSTPTLAPGASATYELTVQVADSASGVITNIATVTDDAPADRTTEDKSAQALTSIESGADLFIEQSATPAQTVPGGNVVYTITAGNAGPFDATDIVIRDHLPIGTTFLSASSPDAVCSFEQQTLECHAAMLINGGSITVTVTIAAPRQVGTLKNIVDVASSTEDPNQANNSSTAETSVNFVRRRAVRP